MHIMKKKKSMFDVHSNFLRHSKRSVENGFFLSLLQHFDWKHYFVRLETKRKKNVTPANEMYPISALQHQLERTKFSSSIWLVTRLVCSIPLAQTQWVVAGVCCNSVCRYCQLNLIHASILLFHNMRILNSTVNRELAGISTAIQYIKLASSNSIWYQTEKQQRKNRGTQGKKCIEQNETFDRRWVCVRVLLPVRVFARSQFTALSALTVCAWYACTNFFLRCACCSDFYAPRYVHSNW